MKPGNQPSKKSSKVLIASKGRGSVDLNCDMGEGSGNDALIMPFISSANIACGYHAGNEKTIWQTIELAVKKHVAVGAHVSFPDRENFGRSEMRLPPAEIYELVTQQLILINEIIDSFGIALKHVKPHGALYNISARDPIIAKTIAEAVKDFDPKLLLFGLSGSHSIKAARAIGLQAVSETFADRRYTDEGSLVPRSQPHALIENVQQSVGQVLQMINHGAVTTINGKKIPLLTETICIHSDGIHAAEFAKHIKTAIEKQGILVRFPAS